MEDYLDAGEDLAHELDAPVLGGQLCVEPLLAAAARPEVERDAHQEHAQPGHHGHAHRQVDLHQADEDLQRTWRKFVFKDTYTLDP